jgi:hypothetical protein
MASIPYSGPADEAYKKICSYIKDNDPLKAYGSDKIVCSDPSRTLSLKGPGYEAQIEVSQAGSGTEVHFKFKPALLLRPLAGKIESMVLQHIKTALT